MREARKLLNIQHGHAGVGDGFAKERLGVGTEIFGKFLFRQGLVNKRALDAHLLERNPEEVKGAAVDRRGGDEVIARLADVEDCEKARRLAGRCQHCRNATFERADLRGNGIIGWVL